MKRAVYALRLWRWWPPVLWARLTNRGQYDPYADMTWTHGRRGPWPGW